MTTLTRQTSKQNDRELHIRLLGEFRIEGSTKCDLHQDRQRLLLIHLLAHRGTPISRRQLAYLFWPESSETQSRTNLRKLIYLVRKELPHADGFLVITAGTLCWRDDAPFTLDVAEFENAIERADQAEAAGKIELAKQRLKEAASLYRGDFAPDFYEDWLLAIRETLRQQYAAVLTRLVHLCEEDREYGTAIGYAQQLLQLEPMHESTYQLLMRLHAFNADRAAMMRTFEACVALLEQELGVPPTQETEHLYQRLLEVNPESQPGSAKTTGPPLAAFFVGRRKEWRLLNKAWQQTTHGRPQVVLVGGETGIGKTALVEAWAEQMAQQGTAVAATSATAMDERLPFSLLVRFMRSESIAARLPDLDDIWLAELARLLPEVQTCRPNLPSPGPLTESWQRHRLFQALTQALMAGKEPRILLLDNIQWCDGETIAWLHFLLRQEFQSRLMIVATRSTDASRSTDSLTEWLSVLLRNDRLTEIELDRLDQTESTELTASFCDQSMSNSAQKQIVTESEGLPLYIVEIMKAFGDRGANGDARIPERIQTLFEQRLDRLSARACEVAGLAAVMGPEFTYDLLVEAADMAEEELIASLEELCQQHILCELQGDVYGFSHQKLRCFAYDDLSKGRRRLLHRRVAYALRRYHAKPTAELRAEIAQHLASAGLPAEARAYLQQPAQKPQSPITMPSRSVFAGYEHYIPGSVRYPI